jgi:hypothetical protein
MLVNVNAPFFVEEWFRFYCPYLCPLIAFVEWSSLWICPGQLTGLTPNMPGVPKLLVHE